MENGYTYMWMLMLYGFLGFLIETVWASVKHKKFIYKGLLNGPICPIYPIVIILIEDILGKYNRNVVLVFIAALLITAALEFLLGNVLLKAFGRKWWDYSGSKYNLSGIICLEKTVIWSVVTTLITVLVQPWVIKLIDTTTSVPALIILTVLLLLFLLDLIVTVLEILTISRKLKGVESIEKILSLSDAGDEATLFEKARSLDKKSYGELEYVMKRYKGTIKSNSLIHKRMARAFPNLCHEEIIEKIAKIRDLYWYMKNK